MPKPPPSQAFVARVQRSVRERAQRHALHVGFGEGRRATDVCLVVVKGERIDVLRHLPDVFEGLDLDQEVVRSSQTPEDFEIVVALMRPKRDRGRVADERRASELGDDTP